MSRSSFSQKNIKTFIFLTKTEPTRPFFNMHIRIFHISPLQLKTHSYLCY